MSKSGGYEVRQIRLEDYDLLSKFYHENYPHNAKLNNRDLWMWEFHHTPNFKKGTTFFVLADQSSIGGGIGCLIRELQINDEVADACHPVDFFVKEDCRGFPALRLFRAVLSQSEVFFASYVSGDAARLTSAQGFLNFDNSVKKYVYSISPDLRNTNGIRFFRSLAVAMVRQFFAIRVAYKLKASLTSLSYLKTDKILPEHIPSIEEQKLPGRIGLLKNHEYIRWRYQDSPALNCRFFCQKKKGKVNCLYVVHLDKKNSALILLDVIRATSNEVEIAHGVLKLMRAFKKEGCKIALTTAMNSVLHNSLTLLGFGIEESDHRFIYYAKSKDLVAKMSSENAWDFNLGDTDVY